MARVAGEEWVPGAFVAETEGAIGAGVGWRVPSATGRDGHLGWPGPWPPVARRPSSHARIAQRAPPFRGRALRRALRTPESLGSSLNILVHNLQQCHISCGYSFLPFCFHSNRTLFIEIDGSSLYSRQKPSGFDRHSPVVAWRWRHGIGAQRSAVQITGRLL